MKMNANELYYSRDYGLVEKITSVKDLETNLDEVYLVKKLHDGKQYTVTFENWTKRFNPLSDLIVVVTIPDFNDLSLSPVVNFTNDEPVLEITVSLGDLGYGNGWVDDFNLTLESGLGESNLKFKVVEMTRPVETDVGLKTEKVIRDLVNGLFSNVKCISR